jgi:hypothetical protein
MGTIDEGVVMFYDTINLHIVILEELFFYYKTIKQNGCVKMQDRYSDIGLQQPH